MRNHSTLETIAPRNFSLESGLYVNYSVPCALNSKCQLKPHHSATFLQPLQVPPMFRFHADPHVILGNCTSFFCGFVFEKCVLFLLKKSSFYFKFCLTQQTWHLPPPPPFQLSIYSPHSIQGPASSYYYADCSWSVKAGFVCSSRCSWWRFIEETDWNEYAKTDVLSSSSFALWTEQCLAVTCLCWYIHDAGKKVCIYSYETIVLSQTFFYLIALFNTGLGSLTSKEGHSAVNQKSFSVDNVRAVLKSDGEVDLLST